MSPQTRANIFGTTNISQWLGLTRPKPLTEVDCYARIYNALICYVPHYSGREKISAILNDWNRLLDAIIAKVEK